MRIRFLPYLALLLCLWAFPDPAPAWGQVLLLEDMALSRGEESVRVRVTILLQESDPVEALLKDGAALELDCQARLSRKRDFWMDEPLLDTVFESRVQADNLTREFVVKQPDLRRPIRAPSLKEALLRAWEDVELELHPLDLLTVGEDYLVQVEASLKYADVPPWLKKSLFFWSWDVAPVAVRESEWRYEP